MSFAKIPNMDEEKSIEIIYSEDEDSVEELVEEIPDELLLNLDEVDDDIQLIVDDSKLTFTRHEKSVFAGDLTKDNRLAVTGGEDDTAFVWQTDTGNILFECTGHKDSVTEVAFNHDDHYVATADMAGMIQVWEVADGKLIWCYEGEDVEWLQWHSQANILFCGCQSGDIFIWQIPQGNCKVLPSHGVACTCAKLLPDGKRLIAGYNDGQLKLWDIKTINPVWQLGEKQKFGLTQLDISSDGSLVATAPSADVYKLTDGKTVGKFLQEQEKDVEAVLFFGETGATLTTGSLTGRLCVWDVGRRTVRDDAQLECGVTVMRAGTKDTALIGAIDGVVYVCDVRSGSLIKTLNGHRAEVLSISFNKNGTNLLTTSNDGTAKIFPL